MGSSGFSGDGGPATAAHIPSGGGLSFNAGNLFLADETGNRIRKINLSSGIISTFAGTGTSGFSGDGGPSTAAQFYYTCDVACDATGNLYVTDRSNERVRKITNSCTGTPTAGTANASPSSGFATTGFTLSLTGASTMSGITYQWQSSASGTGGWTSITGATNATYSFTGISANTYYQCIVTCTSSSLSATSSVTEITSALAGINGLNTVCVGSSITLSDSTAGGVWSSSSPAIATIGSTTGTVNGISAGVATITYVFSGSSATYTITVSPLPNAGSISGGNTVCLGGSTLTLSDAVSGGTWSSSNSSASVSSGGVVTGASSGTDTIKYTVTNSCGTAVATKIITVTHVASAGSITGGTSVCVGAILTLTDAASGGVWSSTNSSIASVGSTGIVTGVTAGADTIKYTVTNACGSNTALDIITVNPLPNAGSISGGSTVCVGSTLSLSDAASGGYWTSVSTSIATVSSGGLVTGVTAGTDSIKYTVYNSCGLVFAFKVVTVTTVASAGTINGGVTVCAGSTLSLSDAVSGGVWSSTGTNASVNSSGLVTGFTAGADTIKYTVTNSCGTATAIKLITVNPLPSAGSITGGTSVCAGSTLSLSDATSGGVWSSTNSSIATINSAGLVTGVASGSDTIKYTVSNTCGNATSILIITVNPAPNAGSISGGSTVCTGSTLSLSDAVSGGTWSSTNTSRATVSVSGLVTGLVSGSDTIKYSVTNTCGTATTFTVISVSPGASAGSISGGSTVCAGSTLSLSDATSGGVWSSTNTSIATVNSAGLVTGVASGSDTIKYSVTNTCGTAVATHIITVTPLPNAGSISGGSTVCVGGTLSLSDAVSGGIWSSSNTNASVSAGLVTGINAGNDTIKYSVSSTCGTATATQYITINPAANAGSISGGSSVCVGSTLSLSDVISGGVWSSTNTSIATVAGGLVTGVAAGADTIKYSVTNSCGTATAIQIININSAPNAGTINGANNLCSGTNITLSDAVPGGSWSSSDVTKATINSAGVVTGVAAGNLIITYTVTNTCGTGSAIYSLTVNSSTSSLPAIRGAGSICAGATTTLVNTFSGGVWTSSTPTVATVSSSTGVVTGVSAGTATITYTVTNSCGTGSTTFTEIVNANPVAITGAANVCSGGTASLNDVTAGGHWSSNNAAVATIGSATGIVTGVSNGTTTISYTLGNSCYTTYTETIFSTNPVSGPNSVCKSGTLTLTDATSGGTWSSSNTAIATVSAGGVVTGANAGTALISYTTTGCGPATYAITINPNPAAFSGSNSVCVSGTTTLSDSLSGGTWSSSNSSIATIGATTGIINAITAGSVTISYVLPTGCYTTATETISTMPAISGSSSVCTGTSTTLSDAITAGTWSSSNSSIASIGSATGIATGVANGTATITYVKTGCTTTRAITVNASPSAISGTSSLCSGSTLTLSNTVSGGIWSSANAGIATIGSTTGVVTGVSSGTATVSYILANGCYSTKVTTVNASPAAISGNSSTCLGTALTLSNTVSGGAWSSSNTTIATVSGSGVVTPVTVGSPTITYTIGTCYVTKSLTVTAVPSTVSGPNYLCNGSFTIYTDGVSGGTWTSSNPAIATVVSGSGVVTGVATGIVTITYSTGVGCNATKAITINTTPAAISGGTGVCVGHTLTISDATAGGVWTSSNTAKATAGSTTGIVTGIATGTVTISYSIGTCPVTLNITVNPNATGCTGREAETNGNITNANEYSIFPNPSNGIFNIAESNMTNEQVSVRVYNYTGTIVYNNNIEFNNGSAQLNVTDVVPGIYLISIMNKEGAIKNFRVVVQK